MTKVARGGEAQYSRRVRGFFGSLWRGDLSAFEFVSVMVDEIQSAYRQAFLEGAAKCGIKEDELSSTELSRLATETNTDFAFLPGVADFIEENSRANGVKLRSIMPRANIWINRYAAVRNLGQQLACKDKKLMWVISPAVKEHCVDALRLDGRVHRASVWEKYDIRPQSPLLQCKGFRCLCSWQETDDPALPGRPPKLSGQ